MTSRSTASRRGGWRASADAADQLPRRCYPAGDRRTAMNDWLEDEPCMAERRWPLAPTDLLPRERWLWWEQLWVDVLMLGRRYRLWPAKDWWQDAITVEALAA